MQILSDFSGVLTLGFESFPEMVSKQSVLLAKDPEVIPRNLSNTQLRQLFRKMVSEDDFWADLAFCVSCRFPEDLIKGEYGNLSDFLKEVFYETAKTAVPGTLDVYKRILYYPMHVGHGGKVGKGIPDISIVADYVDEMIPLVHQWHPELFEIVKAEFWSSKLRQLKTDQCFFRQIIKGDRDEYLFISADRAAIDTVEKLGVPSIRFVDAEHLERKMDELGFVLAPKED